MNLTATTTGDLKVDDTLSISNEEIISVFGPASTPADEDLFFKWRSPVWATLKVSERLAIYSRIAAKVEAADEAVALAGSTGAAIPKPPAA